MTNTLATDKCVLCKTVPCKCPKNDHPAQRRIVAGIWALREIINSWFENEIDEHPEGCDCTWCEDVEHTLYMLNMQRSALESNMQETPGEDESCLIILAFANMLARYRGLVDDKEDAGKPATVPLPILQPTTPPAVASISQTGRRKRWWIEFGCTTGDAS